MRDVPVVKPSTQQVLQSVGAAHFAPSPPLWDLGIRAHLPTGCAAQLPLQPLASQLAHGKGVEWPAAASSS